MNLNINELELMTLLRRQPPDKRDALIGLLRVAPGLTTDEIIAVGDAIRPHVTRGVFCLAHNTAPMPLAIDHEDERALQQRGVVSPETRLEPRGYRGALSAKG